MNRVHAFAVAGLLAVAAAAGLFAVGQTSALPSLRAELAEAALPSAA